MGTTALGCMCDFHVNKTEEECEPYHNREEIDCNRKGNINATEVTRRDCHEYLYADSKDESLHRRETQISLNHDASSFTITITRRRGT